MPARIAINGKTRARKSRRANIRVKAGLVHTVRVAAPGRRAVTRKVHVPANKRRLVKVFLKRISKKKRRRR